MFRIYEIDILFNEKHLREAWIDPHYEVKHSASINDELILQLLEMLNRKSAVAVAESNGFDFYEIDIEFKGKLYRMILVVPLDGSYLGVRNTYRRSK